MPTQEIYKEKQNYHLNGNLLCFWWGATARSIVNKKLKAVYLARGWWTSGSVKVKFELTAMFTESQKQIHLRRFLGDLTSEIRDQRTSIDIQRPARGSDLWLGSRLTAAPWVWLCSSIPSRPGGRQSSGSPVCALLETEAPKRVLLFTVPEFLKKPPSTTKSLRKVELSMAFQDIRS